MKKAQGPFFLPFLPVKLCYRFFFLNLMGGNSSELSAVYLFIYDFIHSYRKGREKGRETFMCGGDIC